MNTGVASLQPPAVDGLGAEASGPSGISSETN
jgi:hypothetical protein